MKLTVHLLNGNVCFLLMSELAGRVTRNIFLWLESIKQVRGHSFYVHIIRDTLGGGGCVTKCLTDFFLFFETLFLMLLKVKLFLLGNKIRLQNYFLPKNL